MDSPSIDRVNFHASILDFKKVSFNQVLFIEKLLNNSYIYYKGSLELAFKSYERINTEKLKFLATNKSKDFLISQADYEAIQDKLKDGLIKVTRALSMGDPVKKANLHANFLTMNLENVYHDPFNDELLEIQFKSCSNFANFLMDNKSSPAYIFKKFRDKPLHYTLTQPMLSSVLLLSFIQTLKVFSDKEMENLFLTSYFKDIGLALIPRDKLDSPNLNSSEQDMISDHTQNSISILSGRVKLPKTYLNIIEGHHTLNQKVQSISQEGSLDAIDELKASGIESALVAATDIFLALISDRPYRSKLDTFKALEMIKLILAEDYPQEFKSFVLFIRNFLSKR